jgi:hypothetical protein
MSMCSLLELVLQGKQIQVKSGRSEFKLIQNRLMAANWMSKIFNGQADGLQCRTLEILDSFGFADRVWKESNHMIEICLWVS